MVAVSGRVWKRKSGSAAPPEVEPESAERRRRSRGRKDSSGWGRPAPSLLDQVVDTRPRSRSQALQEESNAEFAATSRRVSGGTSRRDLSPVKYEHHRKVSNYLWQRNPVAKKSITNMRAFVTADGFQVVATSADKAYREKLQGIIDRFWFLNEFDERLSQLVDTLAVDGEWVFVACDPTERGDVKLCKILPENVKDIVRDPLDSIRMDKVLFTDSLTMMENGVETKTKELPVVNRNEEGHFEGRVHLLQINTLAGQTRGFSDLLPVVDWLDSLNRLLYVEVERFEMQKAMCYDVTVEGDASDEKVVKLAEQIEEDGPPSAGDVNVHSSAVKWAVMTPDMKLQDSVEFIRFILMICCGGTNMPPHWFAEGGDVNKATASEMGTPVWAFIRDRKRQLVAFFRQIIRHALHVARAIHQIPEDQLTFSVISRDPDPSAFDLIGKGLLDFLTTLGAAVQAKFMTRTEARRIWRNCLQGLGLGQLLEPVEKSEDLPDAETVDQALQRPDIQEAIAGRFSTTGIDAEIRQREEAYAHAFAL